MISEWKPTPGWLERSFKSAREFLNKIPEKFKNKDGSLKQYTQKEEFKPKDEDHQ